jgi:hypothetical protein
LQSASHAWNFSLKGAKEFQTSVAPGKAVRPKKNARYAVLEEN